MAPAPECVCLHETHSYYVSNEIDSSDQRILLLPFRGQPKVAAHSALLAAANLVRLAVLGTTAEHSAWRASTA